MKKLLILVLAAAASVLWYFNEDPADQPSSAPPESRQLVAASDVARAFENRQSNVQVDGRGRVLRILPDDNKGSRHQRFILSLPSGQTVLVAHNIDLAPRISSLKEGDEVEFFGEYEWNEKGGVIHWTHLDPDGSHIGGWLRHEGRTYE